MKNGGVKGKPVDVVSYYIYLGVKISSRGSWSVAINTLVNYANKGLFKIKSVTQNISNLHVQATKNYKFLMLW